MALNIPSLVVSAVTTFDGKALGKGQKQIASFDKTVKTLAKTFGATFGAAALVNYGKNAVKAFAENEKSAVRLTRVVKNLGLAFEVPQIERNLDAISAKYGLQGEVLREAFQKLIAVTGSAAKSTDLLNNALDISAGSGEDLLAVSQDLASAYVGNTKSLRKYNLGLTQSELKTLKFEDALALLTKTFGGSATEELTTYSAKMRVLGEAADNAQEIIGQGLVDAFVILAGDGGIDGATQSMESFGEVSRDVLVGTASYVDKLLDKLDGLSAKAGGIDLLALIPIVGSYIGEGGVFDKLAQEGRRATGRDRQFGGRYADIYNQQKELANAKERAKAEAAAAKRAKELLALQKKQERAEKNKLSLSKAAAAFDSTRISIAAALQATYDKETKLRLEALMLIEEDRGDEALKKIRELSAFQKSADLQRLAGVETISNATLHALNTQLLTELQVINRSKLAEGDKELAREEAFKKYNAAITAAGTLAAKESYNERVQIQLTEIAKLAAISNTYNAGITSALLLESAELSMIDRVAKAQADADAKRLAALKEYMTLLNGVSSGRDYGGNILGTPVPNFVPPSWAKEGGPDITIGPKALAPLATPPPTTKYDPLSSFQYAVPMPRMEDQFRYDPLSSFNNRVDVTINAGVGDPEAIARAVEDVLNQSTYRGTSVNRGSGAYYV